MGADRSDLRGLREEAARLRGDASGRPVVGQSYYGEVSAVATAAVPPQHTVMLYGGAALQWGGAQVLAVGIGGASLVIGAQVHVCFIPGTGWVCQKIADQGGGGGDADVPNHAHSNANGDGGQTIHGFSY